VLLNVVLDALPTFAMGAVELPPALLQAIDGLRRAFIWNIKDRPSGAKCLVAWISVGRSKEEGGLGIRCVTTKNECLQIKLLHRLHSAPEAPWPRWVWAVRDRRASLGPHWRHLEALMPLYRSISRVTVGNGRCTAFWLNAWLLGGAFCLLLPALFSHALNAEATVADVLGVGVRHALVPWLSTVGES
jgi:hypothetical protein